jgi:transposase
VVLVWDNLNVHLGPELRAFTGAQAWLRVFRLPAYAPDLNPVEMGLPQCELRRSSLS